MVDNKEDKKDSNGKRIISRLATYTGIGLLTNANLRHRRFFSTAPKGIIKPRNGKKDDLVRIKGIGLKTEAKLNSLGIFHYDQIANWTKEEIGWVNSFLHFSGRIEREDWVSQAKILRDGEDTEFAKRVDAGKVPSSKRVRNQGDENDKLS